MKAFGVFTVVFLLGVTAKAQVSQQQVQNNTASQSVTKAHGHTTRTQPVLKDKQLVKRLVQNNNEIKKRIQAHRETYQEAVPMRKED